MQQRVFHRIVLMVDDHHRRGFCARDSQVEDGVVSGRAVHGAEDAARADRDHDGICECSVDARRDLPGAAHTARFVLTARGTHLGGDGNIFSQLLSPWSGSKSVLPRGIPWVRGSARIPSRRTPRHRVAGIQQEVTILFCWNSLCQTRRLPAAWKLTPRPASSYHQPDPEMLRSRPIRRGAAALLALSLGIVLTSAIAPAPCLASQKASAHQMAPPAEPAPL